MKRLTRPRFELVIPQICVYCYCYTSACSVFWRYLFRITVNDGCPDYGCVLLESFRNARICSSITLGKRYTVVLKGFMSLRHYRLLALMYVADEIVAQINVASWCDVTKKKFLWIFVSAIIRHNAFRYIWQVPQENSVTRTCKSEEKCSGVEQQCFCKYKRKKVVGVLLWN